ncbi:unnamed protein product [Ixodes pacificus]
MSATVKRQSQGLLLLTIIHHYVCHTPLWCGYSAPSHLRCSHQPSRPHTSACMLSFTALHRSARSSS